MGNWLNNIPAEEKSLLRQSAMPEWIEFMPGRLSCKPFHSNGWIYERKFDGIRCMAFVKAGEIRLMSRNKKSMNHRFPELVNALGQQVPDFIIDGEIVAFDSEKTSLRELQKNRIGAISENSSKQLKLNIYCYIFDLIYVDGYDLSNLPLITRKSLLKKIIRFEDPLRYAEHDETDGIAFFWKAHEKGWEGIMAKKADSPYTSVNSEDWIQFNHIHREPFLIGGYTEPRGSRIGFGALLIGYYKGKKFIYAGKVGTGYTKDVLVSLSKKLRDCEQEENPFDHGKVPEADTNIHWVAPKYVCEIEFTEETKAGLPLYPTFRGLREDKSPRDIRR